MNIQRLHELYCHLKYGDLAHEKFDFTTFSRNATVNQCGSAGCAIGECPDIWPNDWKWNLGGYNIDAVTLKGDTDYDSFEGAEEWFELSYYECRHLFSPDEQRIFVYGGKVLGNKATANQVANNIKAFIDKEVDEEMGL